MGHTQASEISPEQLRHLIASVETELWMDFERWELKHSVRETVLLPVYVAGIPDHGCIPQWSWCHLADLTSWFYLVPNQVFSCDLLAKCEVTTPVLLFLLLIAPLLSSPLLFSTVILCPELPLLAEQPKLTLTYRMYKKSSLLKDFPNVTSTFPTSSSWSVIESIV